MCDVSSRTSELPCPFIGRKSSRSNDRGDRLGDGAAIVAVFADKNKKYLSADYSEEFSRRGQHKQRY